MARAVAERAAPANPVPPIRYPESLPVSSRREEIARAIAAHPVVIVSGETGSGKTTQLPKIALELGRGRGAGGRGLIGHTQPRRIAAISVAKRIAFELGTEAGEVVGVQVRFHERLAPGASVKLMTDGILLAETQRDPLLRAYDTLIIDEAHERSLNIDFLLGYLKRILPERPDLKLVVTSATIDAERFAAHFASRLGPAPVIRVSGRLYPVEQRWRPIEAARGPAREAAARAAAGADARARAGAEVKERGLNDAIADAVDELWREGPGDVLVFLPGEREIRDAAEHLQRHFARVRDGGPPVQILPLFARLSQPEQERVFTPGDGRRIVLATNVAETSLTVPGIRYVVDPGLARVKRYSYRNKVEQLQVEPISQAAADQRAGRCGRVADGICIRLYDEAAYAARPRFTDPEIVRSSLAGVILRMKALGLGRVEDFPFLEAPPRKAIADGYALLAELNALDDANELTPIGAELSKLPIDPRVGRMILEARCRESLAEVLVIAAALSVADVRDRPLDEAQAADEKHRRFDDERSEFVGLLKLWRWIDEGRGHAAGDAPKAHKLSNRQQEQRLREHFVSPRRVREWRDVHAQLHTVVAEHGWRINALPATYEQIHLALLAGLLGNVGAKGDDEAYLGARGIKFWPHPGAHLAKKPGRWIVAAELVETTRLYGRGLAAIDPGWIPVVAGHVLKTQLLEPHWQKTAARVVAFERATLYGLVVYSNRPVDYGRVDPAAARELFIREALVGDGWETRLPFLAHNRRLVREIEALEHKARRQDVLVDESLIHAYYDRHVPADVVSGADFERWYRRAAAQEPRLLHLSRDELMRHEAAGVTTAAFPPTLRLGGIDCTVAYLHAPGDPKDGMTVTLPIYALNRASEERAEWLVPGLVQDKVVALLKSLPQRPRSRLVPLAETAAAFVEATPFGEGSLVERLLAAARERTQLPLQRADFKLETLAPHLQMNFRLVDETGRQLALGRDLAGLKAQFGSQARSAFQALAALGTLGAARPAAAAAAAAAAPAAAEASRPAAAAPHPRTDAARYTDWSFGQLPELMELRRGTQALVGFPALVDRDTHVELEVFDEPAVAAARHRAGLVRLFALQLREPQRHLERSLPDFPKAAVLYMAQGGTADALRRQVVDVAIERAFLAAPLPADAAAFARRLEEGRPRFVLIAQEVARLASAILVEAAAAQRKLKDARVAPEVADDVAAQLARLVPKSFLRATPWERLEQLPRYLKAVQLRLDKWRSDPARDRARMDELRPLEQRYLRRLAELKGAPHERLGEFRWLLEELRVGLFAQELRTPQPVSTKRLEKAWAQLAP